MYALLLYCCSRTKKPNWRISLIMKLYYMYIPRSPTLRVRISIRCAYYPWLLSTGKVRMLPCRDTQATWPSASLKRFEWGCPETVVRLRQSAGGTCACMVGRQGARLSVSCKHGHQCILACVP